MYFLTPEKKVNIFFDYIAQHNPEIRFNLVQYDTINQIICQFDTLNQIELLAQSYILGYYGKYYTL